MRSSLFSVAVVLASAAAFAPSASADPARDRYPVSPLTVRRMPTTWAVQPARPVSPVYAQHLVNTRGIDPNGAIAAAGWGGSAGRYATQAVPVRQATQATQATQYRQPRFVRPPLSIPVFFRGPRR